MPSLLSSCRPGLDFSCVLVYSWWVNATVSKERTASMFILLPIVVSVTGGSTVLRNVCAYVLYHTSLPHFREDSITVSAVRTSNLICIVVVVIIIIIIIITATFIMKFGPRVF